MHLSLRVFKFHHNIYRRNIQDARISPKCCSALLNLDISRLEPHIHAATLLGIIDTVSATFDKRRRPLLGDLFTPRIDSWNDISSLPLARRVGAARVNLFQKNGARSESFARFFFYRMNVKNLTPRGLEVGFLTFIRIVWSHTQTGIIKSLQCNYFNWEMIHYCVIVGANFLASWWNVR